ncbi:MAG: YihY/virulence factor BrkB family protein [Oscillospiraceae bacterium]|jgi:membrane protein|nr:YihY/virulence factor BrkB family protein [Oscillospiraceae bacterium]MDD3260663.1 YihY/virulence factor BrkB family protein [Oscillospiraceae bacterium]
MKEKLALPYEEQPIYVRMIQRYLSHDIGRCAAALAYYFLFTLFPTLILLTLLLTRLGLSAHVVELLRGILPKNVLETISGYMQHVLQVKSNSKHISLLLTSTFLLFYFIMRAMNCVLRYVSTAYGYRSTVSPVRQQINLFIATIFMVLGILVALGIINVGRTVLRLLAPALHLSSNSINLWNLFRFFLLAGILFLMLFSTYYLVPNRTYKPRQVLPGTLLAMLTWMIFSLIYAFYVENIGNYSLIYGTLGAAIVLLLWLYFSGFVLILGAELNAVIMEMNTEMKKKQIVKFSARWRYLWVCGWDPEQVNDKPETKNGSEKGKK